MARAPSHRTPSLPDYLSGLLPAIKQYIGLRQKAAGAEYLKEGGNEVGNRSPQAFVPRKGKSPLNELSLFHSRLTEGTTTSLSMPSRSVSPTSRSRMKNIVPASSKMLSDIAWLGEEYLRTSREKVSITQTVHDSVRFNAFFEPLSSS